MVKGHVLFHSFLQAKIALIQNEFNDTSATVHSSKRKPHSYMDALYNDILTV